jgi:hypothetical protein
VWPFVYVMFTALMAIDDDDQYYASCDMEGRIISPSTTLGAQKGARQSKAQRQLEASYLRILQVSNVFTAIWAMEQGRKRL